MVKKIIAVATAILMLCCMVPLAAFADNVLDTCPKCGERTYETWQDFSTSVPDLGFPISIKRRHCTSCQYTYYDWNCMGYTGYKEFDSGSGNLIVDYLKEWKDKTFGKNATAKKYETGGGSAGTGGVGRNPSGYSGTGTPSIAANGEIQYTVYPELGASQAEVAAYPTSFVASNGNSGGLLKVAVNGLTCNVTSTFTSSDYLRLSISCRYSFTTPVAGRYYLAEEQNILTHVLYSRTSSFGSYGIDKFKINSNYSAGKSIVLGFYGPDFYATKSISSYTAYFHPIVINCIPATTNITNYNKITINNNTWNGNIYQDNSTNLTYIYPQYTTINENNETVTNISNNPIIYNNTTNQYYTYDTVTNNYYYITYETATPTPSPSPDPGTNPTPTPEPSETPTPTPAPGGDTGDTSSLLDVLIEIKDNMIQGFADLKATLVQGWADLSANFTLAIENLNLNITNIFNKKFPDQSTPETAQPSPSPSPSPEPVDPILPETQNLIIPKMNSNTFTDEHGTWVASGSSKYSDVFDFFHAFDRSTSDFWETNASPSYLQIEIPDPESYYIDGYIMRISKFNNRYAKDWTLQGSDDGNTWDDLDKQTGQNLSDMEEHKYPLTLRKAYKYYRLNMSNYASSMCSLSHFNLLGYDAKDVVTPTPSPSPTPDPGETPTPTPAPTDKPSNGNTNNFWNFVFPGVNDDGTENGHKGILWALISLLIAVITFVLGLGSAYSYVFPFLPAGLVTTIHICVLVLLLFAIIKFVRSFL